MRSVAASWLAGSSAASDAPTSPTRRFSERASRSPSRSRRSPVSVPAPTRHAARELGLATASRRVRLAPGSGHSPLTRRSSSERPYSAGSVPVGPRDRVEDPPRAAIQPVRPPVGLVRPQDVPSGGGLDRDSVGFGSCRTLSAASSRSHSRSSCSSQSCPAPPPRPPAPSRTRASATAAADVKAIQGLLRARGATIAVDGIFGTTTRDAVKVFQAANGLTANGVVRHHDLGEAGHQPSSRVDRRSGQGRPARSSTTSAGRADRGRRLRRRHAERCIAFQ